MKVYISCDEAYPVYGAYPIVIGTGLERHYKSVEIPDELYKRYLIVEEEYNEVQGELKKYSCE